MMGLFQNASKRLKQQTHGFFGVSICEKNQEFPSLKDMALGGFNLLKLDHFPPFFWYQKIAETKIFPRGSIPSLRLECHRFTDVPLEVDGSKVMGSVG